MLTTAMLYYAREKLKLDKLCFVNYILAGTKKAYQDAVDQWTKLTGKRLTIFDQTLPPQGDYTPYVLKAKKAGCQMLLSNAVEPQALSWMKIVDQQKISGIKWFFLAPGYSDAVAKALRTPSRTSTPAPSGSRTPTRTRPPTRTGADDGGRRPPADRLLAGRL